MSSCLQSFAQKKNANLAGFGLNSTVFGVPSPASCWTSPEKKGIPTPLGDTLFRSQHLFQPARGTPPPVVLSHRLPLCSSKGHHTPQSRAERGGKVPGPVGAGGTGGTGGWPGGAGRPRGRAAWGGRQDESSNSRINNHEGEPIHNILGVALFFPSRRPAKMNAEFGWFLGDSSPGGHSLQCSRIVLFL